MPRKAARESQSDVTDVQGDTDGDVTLSETVYSDWCEPLDVENPTIRPCVLPELVKGVDLKLPNGTEELIKAQKSDTDLVQLCNKALSVEAADKVPVCYFVKDGVLMRKYRPPNIPATDEWKVYRQIVVLTKYKSEMLALAHSLPISGHLGVNKTEDRILQHFYWPKLRRSVAEFVTTCHVCQMVGKPNQNVKPAPLKPVPAFN